MKTDSHSELKFAKRITTNFWHEEPCTGNPYLAERCRLHGYDIFDLMERRSFVEVLFLLFKGELPDKDQAKLLEQLMIFQINPGPRHPASRAAMTAGISKTRPAHLLPIGLMVLSGDHLGAMEVEKSMEFLRSNRQLNVSDLAKKLLAECSPPSMGDWHIAPGFGSRYGGIDPTPNQFANFLGLSSPGQTIKWGNELVSILAPNKLGWLNSGIAAAVFLDLGIAPREGAGLFQLISAPGILAHGMEQSHKPVTDMPFVQDQDYVIE